MAKLVVFVLLALYCQAFGFRRSKVFSAEDIRASIIHQKESIAGTRPTPASSAPAGSLLVLEPGTNGVTLAAYAPSTGKIKAITTYTGYAAGSFKGLDAAGHHVFVSLSKQLTNGSYEFVIATVNIANGKIKTSVPFPSMVIFDSTYDAGTGVLVGAYEDIDTATNSANLTVSTVSIKTGNIQQVLHQFNSSYGTTSSSFDTAHNVMYATLFVSGASAAWLGGIDYRTGKVVSMPALSRYPTLPVFNAGTGQLIDQSFYFTPGLPVGLLSVDPTTGIYTNLNITLLTGVNQVQVGPTVVDPISQTWFGSLIPNGAPNPWVFFQVDLSKGVITRQFQLTQEMYDTIWVPSSADF
eukprot:TRINITY_DN718_c0_g1_i1.p1 TRINITY_DN718_c0_g1~~TRINITY_DN718_c0_g1_i1.p1  ORF type:complete len:353 (+),score=96.30 TRINITY_DN718_c0_g1_i1:88-1146(+)